MTIDHYRTLGLEPGASAEEIKSAYESVLANRKARRQKNGDVHQAIAVLGDPTLRAAYDLKRHGSAVSDKLLSAKDAAVGTVADVIAEVDMAEVMRQAREVGLKGVVVLSGASARTAELTMIVSRKVQVAAARRLGSVSDPS